MNYQTVHQQYQHILLSCLSWSGKNKKGA